MIQSPLKPAKGEKGSFFHRNINSISCQLLSKKILGISGSNVIVRASSIKGEEGWILQFVS